MLEHQIYVDQVETPLYGFEKSTNNRIGVMQTMDCYNTFLISHLTMGSYIDSYLYFTFHLNNINIECLLKLSLEKKTHKRMGFKMTLYIFICLHMS